MRCIVQRAFGPFKEGAAVKFQLDSASVDDRATLTAALSLGWLRPVTSEERADLFPVQEERRHDLSTEPTLSRKEIAHFCQVGYAQVVKALSSGQLKSTKRSDVKAYARLIKARRLTTRRRLAQEIQHWQSVETVDEAVPASGASSSLSLGANHVCSQAADRMLDSFEPFSYMEPTDYIYTAADEVAASRRD